MGISALTPPTAEDIVETVLEFPDNRLLIDLCGEFDRNLAQIEHLLSVHVLHRGNRLAILGEARETAAEVLKKLYARLEAGRGVEPGDIDAAIRLGGSVEGTGVFEGYASVFNRQDLGRDVVLPGAFRESLSKRGAAGVRMLFQHDPGEPIGVWEKIYEDARGLFVRGRIMTEVTRGREVLALMRANHLPDGKDLSDLSISLFSESIFKGVGFGLGFAMTTDVAKTMVAGSKGEYWWGGAASTAFWVDPMEDICVVFLTQFMPSSLYPIRRELRTMVNAAVLESKA